MTDKQLDEALSFEGLRALAMCIVKDIDQRLPAAHFKDVYARRTYLAAMIDACHRTLVAVHEEMTQQGVQPRQCMQELAALGHHWADEEVTLIKASKRSNS
jgi:hypothetical protein